MNRKLSGLAFYKWLQSVDVKLCEKQSHNKKLMRSANLW